MTALNRVSSTVLRGVTALNGGCAATRNSIWATLLASTCPDGSLTGPLLCVSVRTTHRPTGCKRNGLKRPADAHTPRDARRRKRRLAGRGQCDGGCWFQRGDGSRGCGARTWMLSARTGEIWGVSHRRDPPILRSHHVLRHESSAVLPLNAVKRIRPGGLLHLHNHRMPDLGNGRERELTSRAICGYPCHQVPTCDLCPTVIRPHDRCWCDLQPSMHGCGRIMGRSWALIWPPPMARACS